MTRQRLIGLGIAMAVLATCSLATADLVLLAIPGVTGTAFHQGDNPDPGDGSISRVFDGAGLTVGNPGDSNTWTHDAAYANDWQGQGSFVGGNTPGAWLVADLGSVQTELADLYIWNVREVLDRGAKDIDIHYATNTFPPSAWTLLGSYTISQATGGGTPADIVISLNGIPSARYIGFDILTNYGSTFRVGVAEMQFTVVPEPSSVLLAGSALAVVGLLFLKRRRS